MSHIQCIFYILPEVELFLFGKILSKYNHPSMGIPKLKSHIVRSEHTKQFCWYAYVLTKFNLNPSKSVISVARWKNQCCYFKKGNSNVSFSHVSKRYLKFINIFAVQVPIMGFIRNLPVLQHTNKNVELQYINYLFQYEL